MKPPPHVGQKISPKKDYRPIENMDLERDFWTHSLVQDSFACVREAHALRTRLEELLAAPPAETGYEPSALRGGQAAMLAEAILGGAAAQKVVDMARWLGRMADFVRWVRQYSQWTHTHEPSEDSETTSPLPPFHQHLQEMRWMPLEHETTEAEDEIMEEEEGEGEPMRVVRECISPVGVNLYLYMEDDLAQAAEGLVSMPALSAAIAEGLIACRGLNMGLCQAVSEHREAALRLSRARAAQEHLGLATVRGLEIAAAEACKVAHRVLRAVHRGVALMQVALDGVQASAERSSHTVVSTNPRSGHGDGDGDGENETDDSDDDRPPPPPRHHHATFQRRLIRIAAADGSGLFCGGGSREFFSAMANRRAAAARLRNHHGGDGSDEGGIEEIISNALGIGSGTHGPVLNVWLP